MERKLVAIGGGKIPKWSFTTKDDKEIEYETKEIDQEKDRQYVAAMFSNIVALVALVVSLIALVKG